MKTSFKLLVISMLTLLSVISTNVTKSQVSASISFSVFHDNLQAYGRWVSHPRYGQVWIPGVSGFRPYSTGGHWAYTDFGWTWVSDYEWGWAPFHYGRWAYDSMYGWVWIPGYQWGPAWVSWRTGGDYYGWAPLGPDVNISIGVSFGTTIPANYWVFVPNRYITSPVVYRYYAPPARNVTIIKNTTIINDTHETNVFNQKTVVIGGPRREDVERVAHTKVQVMHVNDATKPSREVVDKSRNTINVYRPVINKTTVNKNVTINNTTVNKNTTNNTRVNKNTTVNNNKEVNKTQTNKTTVNNNKKNVTRNGVVSNKTTTNKEEANRTLGNKEAAKNANNQENNKTASSHKQTQQIAPANTNKQDAVKSTENGGSADHNRVVEKKPAQKSNEEPAHKPDENNDNNKPKRSQESVNADNSVNSNPADETRMKRGNSKIESGEDSNKNEIKSSHSGRRHQQ